MAQSDWLNVERQEYRAGTLTESSVAPDPITQFRAWWEDCKRAKVLHPDQMSLATATRDGRPSARIVLLKLLDEKGFVFVTNYESRKGAEIAANPHVALCFYWEELERQVRIEGAIEKISAERSAEYFHSRPRAAQLGAWASRQSKPIAGRGELESAVAAAEGRFGAGEIDLPHDWGGYCVIPGRVEFWQGRESRLHDRLVYERTASSAWSLTRLAP